MPPVIQAILSAARHAQEGGTMAGLLLRVDSRVRGKSLKTCMTNLLEKMINSDEAAYDAEAISALAIECKKTATRNCM
jgi:hypothetical protein